MCMYIYIYIYVDQIKYIYIHKTISACKDKAMRVNILYIMKVL